MAIPSPNMNLTIWNDNDDFYEHAQLAANFTILDTHDHSANRGVQINTPGIANSAITTALLANSAVTNAILAVNAVATSNIQSNAVTGAEIAPQTVTAGNVANNTITYGQLDKNIVPLGTVTLWWRQPGSTAIPGGNWEIMDGRPWNQISNTMGTNGASLTSGNIPDMRGAFPLGADVNGAVAPAIGAIGGSSTASLAHYHNVVAHAHTVPPHTHGINSDGSHAHTWAGGLEVWTRTNAFDIGLLMEAVNPYGSPIGTYANKNYTTYIKNLTSNNSYLQNIELGANGTIDTWYDAPLPMDIAGLHAHTGLTQQSYTLTTGNTTGSTDTQLGNISTVPEYVSLLCIMRVR
jgi:hypothetical protein